MLVMDPNRNETIMVANSIRFTLTEKVEMRAMKGTPAANAIKNTRYFITVAMIPRTVEPGKPIRQLIDASFTFQVVFATFRGDNTRYEHTYHAPFRWIGKKTLAPLE